jgi:NAD(P)-dependent dehydrogenase (short-subunit alcohol dehydrogenase family)
MSEEAPLAGRVALVAGATRGAGRAIAVELARAGAHVYATGRSSRTAGRSELDRPETIEETGDLIEAAGGSGTALVVDHEEADAVARLVARIETDRLQVHGSGALIRWLLANVLVDEMTLLIVPVVLGQGARLFPDAGPDLALDLVDSRADSRGVTTQVYRPNGRPQYAPATAD